MHNRHLGQQTSGQLPRRTTFTYDNCH